MKIWAALASGLLALAVAFGAFGAHALKSSLSERFFEVYKTANEYHFLMALGLLLVTALPVELISVSARFWVCVLLLLGITLFSGSLYLMALTGLTRLGMITPLGGLSLIFAWALLAWKLWVTS